MNNSEIRKVYDKIAMREYGRKYGSSDLLPYEKEQVRKMAVKMAVKKTKKASNPFGLPTMKELWRM